MDDSDVTITEDAAKEELSIGYITQVAAVAGASYDNRRQDYWAIDGTISFIAADLRVQLKSTAQEKYRKPSFGYDLKRHWLEKWSRSQTPVIVVLLVLTADDRRWLVHRDGDTVLRGVGYWRRVDDIAKEHVAKASGGLSVTISQNDRITSTTAYEWDALIQQDFYGMGGAL